MKQASVVATVYLLFIRVNPCESVAQKAFQLCDGQGWAMITKKAKNKKISHGLHGFTRMVKHGKESPATTVRATIYSLGKLEILPRRRLYVFSLQSAR